MDLDDYEEYILSQGSDEDEPPRPGDGAGCFVWFVLLSILGIISATIVACG